MKKTLLLMLVVLMSLGLSGCFRTRTQLFWLPLIETTYVGDPERIDYKDKELTHFSISFIDTKEVDNDYENYQVNQFGDFSFDNIKVFEIILKIGFNNEEEQRYDVTFLGAANPNRDNAYRMSASGSENINIVFDMQTPQNKFFGTIDYIKVSIKDANNQETLAGFSAWDINLDDNDVKSITFSNTFENRNNVFALASDFEDNKLILNDKYSITGNLSYYLTDDITEILEIYSLLSGEQYPDVEIEGYGIALIKREVDKPSNVTVSYNILYWYNGPYLSYRNKDRIKTEELEEIDCYDIVWIQEIEYKLIENFMIIDNTDN